MTGKPTNEDKRTDAEIEKDRAKSENQQNKDKRKAEGDAASWVSPEHTHLSPDTPYVEQKTVPSKQNPENDPEVQAVIKARDQKKA